MTDFKNQDTEAAPKQYNDITLPTFELANCDVKWSINPRVFCIN